jgi:hypothetical protein
MALADDLLGQAHQLARHEPKRPKQASLRRAVSTAYYALFHPLLDAVAREVVSGQGQYQLRGLVARSCQHGAMKGFCQTIVNSDGKKLPVPANDLLDRPLSSALVDVANAFVELQQARHEADYDLSRRIARDDVQELLEVADQAFHSLRSIDKKASQWPFSCLA